MVGLCPRGILLPGKLFILFRNWLVLGGTVIPQVARIGRIPQMSEHLHD